MTGTETRAATREDALLADLAAVQEGLAAVFAGLGDHGWSTPTPAVGWDLRDQLAHLALVEEYAVQALTAPAAFDDVVARSIADGPGFESALCERGRQVPGAELLRRWEAARAGLARAISGPDAPARVAWFGPSMSIRSFLTARMMETWAHGQDVRDALDLPPDPSGALRHVALLGVLTRSWSHRIHGLEAPPHPVAVRLEAPDGGLWSWNDEEAPAGEVVSGTALDFCLVVTQRRHWRDTGLVVSGAGAELWMEVAQAFAGPPTTTAPHRGLKKETNR